MSSTESNTTTETSDPLAGVMQARPKKSRRFLFWLVLFLVIGVAGAVLYLLYWDDVTSKLPWIGDVPAVQQPVVEVATPIETTPASTDDGGLARRVEELSIDLEFLREQNLELRELLSYQPQSANQYEESSAGSAVSLYDVEYLLRIAEQELEKGIDFTQARDALGVVNRLLIKNVDPALDRLRTRIRTEMARVEQLVVPNEENLLERLRSLKDKVGGLTTSLPEYLEDLDAQPSETTQTDERGFWNRVGDFFGSVFIVRRHEDGEVRPMMSQIQADLFEERLLLALDRAHQAVLRNNRPHFVGSLDECLDVLNARADSASPVTTAFVNELEELKAAVLRSDRTPNLKGALELVRTVQSAPREPQATEE